MKATIVLTITIFLNSFLAYGQMDAIEKYFHKYMDHPDFVSIYITGKMFSLMSEIPQEEKDRYVKKQLEDLDGLRILSSGKVNGERMYSEVDDKLDDNGYEMLMVVKEDDQEFKFLVKETGGVIRELLMISGQDNDFFMLSLAGIIDLKTISKISKSLDIDGMEKFEQLDNQ